MAERSENSANINEPKELSSHRFSPPLGLRGFLCIKKPKQKSRQQNLICLLLLRRSVGDMLKYEKINLYFRSFMSNIYNEEKLFNNR